MLPVSEGITGRERKNNKNYQIIKILILHILHSLPYKHSVYQNLQTRGEKNTQVSPCPQICKPLYATPTADGLSKPSLLILGRGLVTLGQWRHLVVNKRSVQLPPSLPPSLISQCPTPRKQDICSAPQLFLFYLPIMLIYDSEKSLKVV